MRYRFCGCALDTERREFRTPEGLKRLEPQVFDLLAYLADNPQRVISREELIERVWGGRIVSEASIDSGIFAARRAVGDDGKRQAVIATVPRRGVRFLPAVEARDPAAAGGPKASDVCGATAQHVRLCHAPDGTRLAFGSSGQGAPLLRVGHWLTHLEHDWHSPIWRPFLEELGRTFCVVRYDQRGTGLSDHEVADLSLEAFVADLETVAAAAEPDRFALYATSQAVPVAVEYAARHPDRLTGLILHGGYAKGRLLRSEAERRQGEAYLTLMEQGWGAAGSQFLQAFGSMFVPDGTPEQIRSLVELQRIATPAETAIRLRRAFDGFDVTERLAEVGTPTLVIHARDDAIHPLDQSREIAARIPEAELLVLESRNHVMLAHDPAWAVFFTAVRDFVARRSGSSG